VLWFWFTFTMLQAWLATISLALCKVSFLRQVMLHKLILEGFCFSNCSTCISSYLSTNRSVVIPYVGLWSSRHAKEGRRNASSCKGKTGKGNANDSDLAISCQWNLRGRSYLGNFFLLRMWDYEAMMPHINMINAYSFGFVQFGWDILSKCQSYNEEISTCMQPWEKKCWNRNYSSWVLNTASAKF